MDCKLAVAGKILNAKVNFAKTTLANTTLATNNFRNIQNRWLAATLFSAVVFGLIACNAPECTVSPQLHLADTLQYKGTTYFLYTRTTGFQEKQVFFELYDKQPIFDQCGVAQVKEIFATDYDHRRFVKEVIVRPDETNYDDRLQLIYTDDASQGYRDVNDVKIKR